MRNRYLLSAIALSILVLTASPAALAQPDASTASAESAMPLASIVIGGSVVAGAVVAMPVALSTSGATLVIKTVESTARGAVYVLERASDGARVSLQISAATATTATGVSLAAGTLVTVSVIKTGVILSTLGEVIAFVPNAIGTALLHNERLTD